MTNQIFMAFDDLNQIAIDIDEQFQSTPDFRKKAAWTQKYFNLHAATIGRDLALKILAEVDTGGNYKLSDDTKKAVMIFLDSSRHQLTPDDIDECLHLLGVTQ